jgi:hypothetical protein
MCLCAVLCINSVLGGENKGQITQGIKDIKATVLLIMTLQYMDQIDETNQVILSSLLQPHRQ